MKIAIFDYHVVPANPAGSCHRLVIGGLATEHEFSVYSNRFDNPSPPRVAWIKIPAIRRPLAALFLSYHLVAAWIFLRTLVLGKQYDIIQSVESNFAFSDIIYCHFCHRWFLKNKWTARATSRLRGFLRWADHLLHALVEPVTFRRAKHIIVPSHGLARELIQEYPYTRSKISVIPNPVDLAAFKRPDSFERKEFRKSVGAQRGDSIVVFVALGHFDRKGLPLLLEALAQAQHAWHLVIVGGDKDLIRAYQRDLDRLGLLKKVYFAGHRKDIRPFLWSADLFALPSSYEVFPLVVLQAAAAGCPVLVTKLNGVEEFLDETNAIVVEHNVEALRQGLRTFEHLSPAEKTRMADRASNAVSAYGVDAFIANWRRFYAAMPLA